MKDPVRVFINFRITGRDSVFISRNVIAAVFQEACKALPLKLRRTAFLGFLQFRRDSADMVSFQMLHGRIQCVFYEKFMNL